MDLAITICFTVGASWSSRLIKWFTWSKISHVCVVYHDPALGIRVALTAEGNGFVAIPWSRFLKKNSLMAEFKPIGISLEESLQWLAKEYLDTGYDYWAAGMTGIKNRFKLVWKWLGCWLKKRSNPQKVMCSESIVRMLQYAGYAAVSSLKPETTDAQKTMEVHFRNKDQFESIFVHSSLLKESYVR